MTERIAFRLWVKPERLEEYKRLHREVWPELLDDLKAAGARNYSIFADGRQSPLAGVHGRIPDNTGRSERGGAAAADG